jgi:XTP/dITP diphosphohydrolase
MAARLRAEDRLVIASHNSGKVWEFQQLFAPLSIQLVSAGDLGVPEPEETGETYAENALLKAVACAKACGMLSLADDSGIDVTALDGAPGIYSARWAGPGKDFRPAMQRVEDELQARGAVDRTAAFVCVLCLAAPDGETAIFEGRVPGLLIWPPRGTNGFGYDPMFMPDGHGVTFGEMAPAQKYPMTHRARAFAKLKAAVMQDDGNSGTS